MKEKSDANRLDLCLFLLAAIGYGYFSFRISIGYGPATCCLYMIFYIASIYLSFYLLILAKPPRYGIFAAVQFISIALGCLLFPYDNYALTAALIPVPLGILFGSLIRYRRKEVR